MVNDPNTQQAEDDRANTRGMGVGWGAPPPAPRVEASPESKEPDTAPPTEKGGRKRRKTRKGKGKKRMTRRRR